MYRDRTWRITQTERWIRRRRKMSLNIFDFPDRNWGNDTAEYINGATWIWDQAHRLAKYTRSCECMVCTIARKSRRFHWHKRAFYRALDRYSEDRW